MDPKISKKTQETLGKIIKKPPLTDKLLSKPPFRFLHDILTEVIRTTGFFKGLYTADEMNSANVKDKDSKIAFLQKAIDVTAMVTGDSLSVRPSKVVAGHEPEKTNEFLQAIAKAVQSKTDSSEAVQKVLAGEKPGSASKSGKKKESKSSKEKDSSSNGNEDKESSGQKDRDKKREDDSRRKEKREDRESSGDRRRREGTGSRERSKEGRSRDRSKDRERSRDKEKDRERERNKENERHSGKERNHEKEREKPRKREKEDESDTIDTGGTAALIDGDAEVENGSSVNRLPRPSSAKGQRRRPHNAESEGPQQDEDDDEENAESGAVRDDKVDSSQMNGPETADDLPPQVASRRKLVRPSSARPAPPKIRKQEDEQEPADRIGSGKQVANVIVDDGKDQDEDEDDTFVVDNTPAAHDSGVVDSAEPVEDDGEHGALVKKMLETKKELEGTGATSKNEPERPVVLNAARRKEKELVEKEIEKLRTSIQTLCRSANPLGKIMDYIQEDMDSMNKELEMWRKENKEYTIRLKQEESKTQSDIEPLKGKLEEHEAEISEMVDKISTVKCNISRNDEKIRQMLSSLSFSTR